MNDISVMGVMRATVPITRFNKGEAHRIFNEVEVSGTKVVMKNNKPVCILMSPSKYESLMEMLSDFIFQEEAHARMSQYNPNESITQEEMMDILGVTQTDLAAVDVEIE